ncbi:MAG: double-strand break repair helicase AddA [Marinibacterium sp.]
MTSGVAGRDEATERQVQAAEPRASTWLSANAGSGKTRVLTDRVARLLLAEVPPQRILCLTYTKAAASEMQNRLFARLGEWAMLNDAALNRALAVLGAGNNPDLSRARTLFARAIETPGGLKIQTIHSFCAALLRRFPLEAGVSPNFSEMEDRAAALLRARIVEDMAAGPQGHLIDAIAAYLGDENLKDLTATICRDGERFSPPLDRAGVLAALGLPADATPDLALKVAFDGSEPLWWDAVIAVLRQHSKTMVELADDMAATDVAAPDRAALERLYPRFLYRDKDRFRPAAKTTSVPSKKAAADLGPRLNDLHDFMERVARARGVDLALAAAESSVALHAFAAAFVPEYTRHKAAHGWLDFDDLILKARALLTDPAVAAWVLFRLDGGIDHILVDEAQDTSPAQWAVIERLAQEFTSGEGARDIERTIFVVGDKKQSIYSFQGADPAEFDRMREEFGHKLAPMGTGLQSLSLDFSFRSSPAILGLVDTVLQQGDPAAPDGLHRAFWPDLPGRVDLWPAIEKTAPPDDGPWYDPLDRKSPRHHDVLLAERIARQIRRMIESETIPEIRHGHVVRRPVQPGDIMILVRRRSGAFGEIIRACKAQGLPVAGADRLKVGAELAVRDLGSLLAFLATPEDDLSLAEALKSPLLGWSEQDLFSLAHDRPGFLWEALRGQADVHPGTLDILDDLRRQTDFLRPYDLIERILTRHDGRRRLLARLGPEAEDGINALLSQALSYEQTGVPSLTGFLAWMQTDDLDIKRETGKAANLIRVMTVHGAKGLEAPVVILPDTAPYQPRDRDLFEVVGGVPLWKTASAEMPPAMQAARDARVARRAAEAQRLLYVAMTRAETWLIVAMAGNRGSGESWFGQIETAMMSLGSAELDIEGAAGLRLSHGDWESGPLVETDNRPETAADLPDHFGHSPPPRTAPPEILTPAGLGGAKALPAEDGLDEDAAKTRGTAVHRLLEHLPSRDPSAWQSLAHHVLAGHSEDLIADCLAEASGILSRPELGFLFAPGTLAEVPLSGPIRGRRLHGVIDRLVVDDDRVLAVDFKTNAAVPENPADVPDGLLRQMGAYARLLALVYPRHRIDTAILWTRSAHLMALPHALVAKALERTPLLDDPGPHS